MINLEKIFQSNEEQGWKEIKRYSEGNTKWLRKSKKY